MIVTEAKPKRSICEKCPLYRKKHVETYHVPFEFHPDDDGNVNIIFKRGAASQGDDSGGMPFDVDTKEGEFFRTLIERANGGSLAGVGFDLGVKCRPKSKSPPERAVSACGRYFRSRVKRHEPRLVVLVGKEAVRQHFPKAANRLGKLHGKRKQVKGVDYFLMQDPKYVLRKGGAKSEDARKLFADIKKALKFAGMGRQMAQATEDETEGENIFVKSVKEVKRIVDTILALPAGSVVACDTETRNLNRINDNQVLTVQLSWDGEKAYVILLRHPKTPFFPEELREVYEHLRRLFSATEVKVKGRMRKIKRWLWLFHNNNFDLHMIASELGVIVDNNPVVDTMQVAHLMDENRLKGSSDSAEYYYPGGTRGLSLDLMLRTYLGEEWGYDQLDKAERGNIANWSLERLIPYAGKDTWGLWRLFREMLLVAEEDNYRKKLMRLAIHLYGIVNPMIVNMERNGFLADIDHLRHMRDPRNSPMLGRMHELEERLKKSKHVKAFNETLWRKVGRGSGTLWGGTPWKVVLTKDAHLRGIFFDTMEYEPVSYTSKEVPQVNKDFYRRYGKWDADGEPLNEVAMVSDWVGINKLQSAFINSIFEWIHPDDGHADMRHDQRVRGKFLLSNTATGRTAHRDPNMGQFPRADNVYKQHTKNIFIAPKGKVILASDLKANEVRWGAICGEDENLGDLFWSGKHASDKYRKYAANLSPKYHKLYAEYLVLEKAAKFKEVKRRGKVIQKPLNWQARRLRELAKEGGKKLERLLYLRLEASLRGDIHKQTAAQFFGVDIRKVTKALRTDTKGIVFGYMYGRSVRSIAAQIKKSVDEAQDLCDSFDRRFPAFANRLKTWPKEAERNYYVESPIGRRRRFAEPIWTMAPEWMAARARRQAKNSPIQGIASDACLVATARLYQYIRKHKLEDRWRILNIVHDAIYLEVPYEDVPAAAKVMEWALTDGIMDHMKEHFGVNFVAPMECDFAVGVRWGELHDWDFSAPHFDVVMAKVALDHKKKWGSLPKTGKDYLKAVPVLKKKAA